MINRRGGIYVSDVDPAGDCIAVNMVTRAAATLNRASRDLVLSQSFSASDPEREYFSATEARRLALTATSSQISISLEVTLACNLRCPYCYQADWARHGNMNLTSVSSRWIISRGLAPRHPRLS